MPRRLAGSLVFVLAFVLVATWVLGKRVRTHHRNVAGDEIIQLDCDILYVEIAVVLNPDPRCLPRHPDRHRGPGLFGFGFRLGPGLWSNNLADVVVAPNDSLDRRQGLLQQAGLGGPDAERLCDRLDEHLPQALAGALELDAVEPCLEVRIAHRARDELLDVGHGVVELAFVGVRSVRQSSVAAKQLRVRPALRRRQRCKHRLGPVSLVHDGADDEAIPR